MSVNIACVSEDMILFRYSQLNGAEDMILFRYSQLNGADFTGFTDLRGLRGLYGDLLQIYTISTSSSYI